MRMMSVLTEGVAHSLAPLDRVRGESRVEPRRAPALDLKREPPLDDALPAFIEQLLGPLGPPRVLLLDLVEEVG